MLSKDKFFPCVKELLVIFVRFKSFMVQGLRSSGQFDKVCFLAVQMIAETQEQGVECFA